MPTDIAKYSIELFKVGGERAGIEEVLDRHADLKVARSIYRDRVEQYPGRLINALRWRSDPSPERSAGAAIALIADRKVNCKGGDQTPRRKHERNPAGLPSGGRHTGGSLG